MTDRPCTEGVVFDIQHFSVHDGPGIRTNVFLKGCPIRCRWCSNPESQQPRPQVTFENQLCIGCGECVRRCHPGAVRARAGKTEIDLRVCGDCVGRECLSGCYARALKLAGKIMTVDQVMAEVLKDGPFYGRSGGVTFTGGEPFFQPDFLHNLLTVAKNGGLSTAVETCLCVDWDKVVPCVELVDTFLCDIKHVDREKLREYTGAEWKMVEQNIIRLCMTGGTVIARVPVVTGFNATPVEIASIAAFTASLGISEMHLLPYHALGKAKYAKLNREYPVPEISPPSMELMAELKKAAEASRLKVVLYG